jgi:hypothetical protein
VLSRLLKNCRRPSGEQRSLNIWQWHGWSVQEVVQTFGERRNSFMNLDRFVHDSGLLFAILAIYVLSRIVALYLAEYLVQPAVKQRDQQP